MKKKYITYGLSNSFITKSTWQVACFWGVNLAIVLYFLYHVKSILLPFALSIIIAYIFAPFVDYMSKKFLSRTIASIIAVALFFGTLVTFLSIVVPHIQSELIFLAKKLPGNTLVIKNQIISVFDSLSNFLAQEHLDKIKLGVTSYLAEIIPWIGHSLIDFITNGLVLANFFVLLVFTPILSFYLLRDWDKMIRGINNFIPENYRTVVHKQSELMNASLRGYFKGQALVSLILTIYYSTTLWSIGLESGGVIGFLTGIFSFIPFIAVISGFIVASITSIYQAPDLWLWFSVTIIFIIGQSIEGVFLTPNLVGNRIGLHPVWLIFVILSGGALFGFWGVLIALPLASLISVLSKFCLEVYYASTFHKASEKQ